MNNVADPSQVEEPPKAKHGFWRGFMREFISLTAWIAAFVIAFAFVDDAAAFLRPYISIPSVRTILAFGGLFVGLFLGLRVRRRDEREVGELAGLEVLLRALALVCDSEDAERVVDELALNNLGV